MSLLFPLFRMRGWPKINHENASRTLSLSSKDWNLMLCSSGWPISNQIKHQQLGLLDRTYHRSNCPNFIVNLFQMVMRCQGTELRVWVASACKHVSPSKRTDVLVTCNIRSWIPLAIANHFIFQGILNGNLLQIGQHYLISIVSNNAANPYLAFNFDASDLKSDGPTMEIFTWDALKILFPCMNIWLDSTWF